MAEKILIVEDDSRIARFLELELKHEGYEVEIASDGRSGLEKALNDNIDLVILDLMLPLLSGIEVLRRIRNHRTYPLLCLPRKMMYRTRWWVLTAVPMTTSQNLSP